LIARANNCSLMECNTIEKVIAWGTGSGKMCQKSAESRFLRYCPIHFSAVMSETYLSLFSDTFSAVPSLLILGSSLCCSRRHSNAVALCHLPAPNVLNVTLQGSKKTYLLPYNQHCCTTHDTYIYTSTA